MTSSQLSKIKQLRELDRIQPQLFEPVRKPQRYQFRYQTGLAEQGNYTV
jgi:hypothetical protein